MYADAIQNILLFLIFLALCSIAFEIKAVRMSLNTIGAALGWIGNLLQNNK